MPVKRAREPKKPRKSAKKKSPRQDVSVDIAREIAAAVERLPEKVMAEYREESAKPARMFVDKNHQSKQRFLLAGVASFVALLVITWGWNARSFVIDAFSHSSGEGLFPKTERDIASFFEKIDQTQPTTPPVTDGTSSRDAALTESFITLFGTSAEATASSTATSSLATTSSAMIR